MALTILDSNERVITVSDNGTRRFVPRDLSNPDYRGLKDFYQDVKRTGDLYLAFPSVQIINGWVVVMFSEGEGHASSSRQLLARKEVADLAVDTEWEIGTFYEESTEVYTFTLLDDIMVDGDTFTFKHWTVRRIAGVVSQVGSPTFTVSGEVDTDLNGDYAVWNGPPRLFGGVWYRTAYKTSGGTYWNVALFESTDRVTWTVTGFIAKNVFAALRFNETDIYERTDGVFVAVIREDEGDGNATYTSTSLDLVTWTTPLPSSTFSGRQPNCMTSSNGDILVFLGDRTGGTGRMGDGTETEFDNPTGISVQRSTDGGNTWTLSQIDTIYSTDGGQPMAVEVSTDLIAILYYGAIQRPDADNNEGETGLRMCLVKTASIV